MLASEKNAKARFEIIVSIVSTLSGRNGGALSG
jgi:hypothetical protein